EPGLLAVTGTGAFIIVLVFIVLVVLPLIYYLLTLQSILKEVSPENRKMEPEQVWLSLIPLFGIIWQYYIVARLADSLRLEFNKRNIYSNEARPGYQTGIIFCILISCIIIPYIGVLALVGGLVSWVIYWVRINEFRNVLIENPLNYLSQ
ncbi:MAG: hypothetical protein WD052_11745, partial [Bacteroidales bacterium]